MCSRFCAQCDGYNANKWIHKRAHEDDEFLATTLPANKLPATASEHEQRPRASGHEPATTLPAVVSDHEPTTTLPATTLPATMLPATTLPAITWSQETQEPDSDADTVPATPAEVQAHLETLGFEHSPEEVETQPRLATQSLHEWAMKLENDPREFDVVH